MKIRKSIKNLSKQEKKDFVIAVLRLKKAPSLLYRNDSSKNRYDDYVETYLQAMMSISDTNPKKDPNWYPGWGQNGPAFFPWNRVLLLQFEKDLQKSSDNPNMSIPYWDWADNHRKSSPFTRDFMGTDGYTKQTSAAGKVIDGPFAYDGPNKWTISVTYDLEDNEQSRSKYLTRGSGRIGDARKLPSYSMVNKALGNAVYDDAPWKLAKPNRVGFRAQVEYSLNNLVHRFINGNMASMTSPNDPVFWLHRANVDRIWSVWQRKNKESSPYAPLGNAPPGHNIYDELIFHEPLMDPPWDDDYSIADVLNHIRLGYAYDTDPSNDVFFLHPHPPHKYVRRPPNKSLEASKLLHEFPNLNNIFKLSGG